VVEVYRAHLETIVVSVDGWWGSCDADYFGITANTTDERIAEIAEAELDEATIRIKSEEGNLPLFDGDLEARIIGFGMVFVKSPRRTMSDPSARAAGRQWP